MRPAHTKTYSRIIAALLLSALLTVMLLLPAKAQPDSEWRTEAVDTYGFFISLSFDSSDNPHLAYDSGGQIKYACRSDGTWHIQTVGPGWYSSLALSASGYPRISYYDNGLKYALWNGTTWVVQTVSSGSGIGVYTSLALDSQGRPHISYADRNNGILKYATFDGSNWTIETIDSGMSYGYPHSSIALDKDDIPHIAYYSGGQLKYASKVNDNWASETVDSTSYTGGFCSLAFDRNNRPHISYWSYTAWKVKYATRSGSGWQITDVASGSYSRLALDLGGHPHIIYWDGNTNTARHAWHDGMQWQTEVIGTAGICGEENWRFAIAVDSDGQPGVAFAGQGIPLTYAERRAPTSSVVLIPDSGGSLAGSDGTVIAFPSGAVSATVLITHTPVAIAQPAYLFSIGRAYSLTAVYSDTGAPATLVPGQTYTVVVPYTDQKKGAAIEDTLALYHWDGSQWVKEASSSVDTVTNQVIARPGHFSLWAVLGETRRVYLPLVMKAYE